MKELHTLSELEPASGVEDRLQVIHVVSKTAVMSDHFVADLMAQEAMDYAGCLPTFLKDLFLDEKSVEGVENKFQGLKPSFLIYDVSVKVGVIGTLLMYSYRS